MKPEVVMKIIEAYDMDHCLIFCRTKLDCDNLEQYFIECGGGSKCMNMIGFERSGDLNA
jgi:ATP-dependent RNA helicase DDX1